MKGLSVRHGSSQADDIESATRAFIDAIAQDDIDWVVFFCSPRFVTDEVAQALQERLPKGRVVGCTTAGEVGCRGYQSGGISGFSVSGGQLTATFGLIENLRTLSLSEASDAIQAIIGEHTRQGPMSAHSNFGFLLIDGLSGREEMLSAAFYQMTKGIPQFGGSAGDELRFDQCSIFHEGRFHSDAALIALVHTDLPFRVFMHQSFEPTERKLVVTEADPKRRIVHELNAEPAAQAYADMVGVPRSELNEAVYARYPVMVRIGGQEYVRSILRANADDSLTFYCAIDEGLVLTLAHNTEMVGPLETALSQVEEIVGPPLLFVGFDCILRRTAMDEPLRNQISDLLQQHHVVGFSTYGEQINGMHVNQTLTGVAIGRGPEVV